MCVEEVFGYGHLPCDFIKEYNIDIEKLAREHDWKIEIGVLTVSFHLGTSRTLLVFGQKPDKKEMRRLVKELKTAKK